MRSRELRITSIIVLFPVVLILVSLLALLGVAIASQVRNLYRWILSSLQRHSSSTNVYENFAVAATTASSSRTQAAAADRAFPLTCFHSLYKRLTGHSVFGVFVSLCFVICLSIYAFRIFNKLRTWHALDSCLEKVAECRMPGTAHLKSREPRRTTGWLLPIIDSILSELYSPPPSPASSTPSSVDSSWLLSRNGNGSITLHPTTKDSSRSARSSPSAFSSELHSRSEQLQHTTSHVYIPKNQDSYHTSLADHKPASSTSVFLPLRQQRSSCNSASASTSLSSSMSGPSPASSSSSTAASFYESVTNDIESQEHAAAGSNLSKHETSVNHNSGKKNTANMKNVSSTWSDNKRNKKKKKEAKISKPTAAATIENDVVVIPAPKSEPRQRNTRHAQIAMNQRRPTPEKPANDTKNELLQSNPSSTTPVASGTSVEDNQQLKLDTQSDDNSLPANAKPKASMGAITPGKPKNSPIQSKQKRSESGANKEQQQNWYSPFSTGFEIDIVSRSPAPSPPHSNRSCSPPTYSTYELFGQPTRRPPGVLHDHYYYYYHGFANNGSPTTVSSESSSSRPTCSSTQQRQYHPVVARSSFAESWLPPTPSSPAACSRQPPPGYCYYTELSRFSPVQRNYWGNHHPLYADDTLNFMDLRSLEQLSRQQSNEPGPPYDENQTASYSSKHLSK